MNPEPSRTAYSLSDLRRDLGIDIQGHLQHGRDFYRGRAGLLRKISVLLTPPMMCVALYRLSHWLWCGGYRRLAWWAGDWNQFLHGAALHPASRIGEGLYIPHTVGVIFQGHAGRNLVLYANAVVAEGTQHPRRWTGGDDSPVLGADVTLGAYCVATGAIRVGDRVRVAPTATLNRSVASDSIVVAANSGRVRAPGADASGAPWRDA